MHIRRGTLGWGVFLILAGSIPLAVRAGYLSEAQVSDLWTLWPMILIGLGIGLLLARTRIAFIGGLIVAATFGLIVGGILSVGLASGGLSAGACGDAGDAKAFAERNGTFAADVVSVDVTATCGDLTIATGPGVAWDVTGKDTNGDGPQIDVAADSLAIRSTDGAGPLGIFSARTTLAVTVPTGPRLDLDIELNAGSATLDMAGAALGTTTLAFNAGSATLDLSAVREIGDLRLELNAGATGITLPDLGVTGTIEANAGSVKLCVPAGIALRLQTADSIAASFDYEDHGLVKDGSTWTTPGFDAATVRIDLKTTGNAASFTLDPEEGCDG